MNYRQNVHSSARIPRINGVLILTHFSQIVKTEYEKRPPRGRSFFQQPGFYTGFCQFICLRRLRFTVPSVMALRESRLLPVPSATQEMASSATTV